MNATPHDPLRLVAFGDSTLAPRQVEGKPLCIWPDRLAAAWGERVQVINAAVPGNATTDALVRFDADVLAHLGAGPAVVLVLFGINDASVDLWRDPPATQPRVNIDRYEELLTHFITAVRQRGAAALLVTPNPLRWTPQLLQMYGGPPYRMNDPQGFDVLVKQYAQRMRRVAQAHDVPLLDLHAAFYDAGDIDALLLDGIHPNAEGHAVAARLAQPLIVDVVRRQGTELSPATPA